jgi:gamma-glutamyltranspeptidase/glutathione hydrolase
MSGLLERDEEARRIFLNEGPLKQPELAETLQGIEGFYGGPVARNAPAPFAPQDFAAHRAEWVEPMRTEWAGLEVCEMPPNSRGHLALRMLEALEPLDGLTPNDSEWHRRLIRAHDAVVSSSEDGGDTIYLCVRDENGMAVSLSQSLSAAFGSGVVIPGTGVLLHNRAEYFKPDEYRGGARPIHTLSPAMALGNGRPHMIFGTMGGLSQLQVHLQLLCRIVIAGQDLAEAVAAPRWRIFPKMLCAEEGLPELGAQPYPYPDLAGHAHVIRVGDEYVEAAFDPRSDGAAVGY